STAVRLAPACTPVERKANARAAAADFMTRSAAPAIESAALGATGPLIDWSALASSEQYQKMH
ncbi:MAG TPA: hypothetical protein VIT92_00590, partial [Burkholderiaceae bacterium]